MKEPTMCILTFHNSQVYKRDYKCHRLTKKEFLSIFTSNKMKRTNGIPKSRQFTITVQSDTSKQQKFKQFSSKDLFGTTRTCKFFGDFSRSKMSLPPSSITRLLYKLNHCPPKYFLQFALSAVMRRHLYFLCVWSSMRVIVLRFSFRIVLDTLFGNIILTRK